MIRAWAALLFVSSLGVTAGQAGALPVAEGSPEGFTTLTADAVVQRSLSGSERHAFALGLPPGRWVLEVDQLGIDCTVWLARPDGSQAVHVSSPLDARGKETVAFEAKGPLVAEVRPRYSSAGKGVYRLRVFAPASDLWPAFEATSRASRHPGDDPETEAQNRTAISEHELAADLWQTAGMAEEQAHALHSAGLLSSRVGDRRRAVELLTRAESLWLDAGRPHLRAAAMSDRGLAQQDLGDLEAADALFRRASAEFQALGDSYGQTMVRNNLCLGIQLRGRLEEARDCYLELLPALRTHGHPGHWANALNSLGGVAYQSGDPIAARRYFTEALALHGPDGNPEDRATVLNNRASLNRYLGRWQEAQADYSRALEIQQASGDRWGEARALNNLGYAYLTLGETGRALDLLAEALELRKELGDLPGQAACLANLATVYGQSGHLEKSLSVRRQASDIYRRLNRPGRRARALIGIARDLRRLGRLDEALNALDQSLSIFSESTDRRFHAYASLERGKIALKLERPEEAQAHLTSALHIHRNIRDFQGEIQARIELAEAALQRDPVTVREHTREAMSLLEEKRIQVHDPEMRAAFLAAGRRAYELDIEAAMALHARDPAARYDIQARETHERGRARALVDLLSRSSRADGGPASSLEQERRDLLDRYRFLTTRRLRSAGRPGPSFEQDGRRLDALAERLDDLDARLAATQHRNSATSVVPVAQIQQSVAPGSVLIEIALGRSAGYLWWIDRDGIETVPIPGRELLEELALETHGRLSTIELGAAATLPHAADELGRRLLGRLATRLSRRPEGTRLMIVADGALAYLPFAALPIPGTDQLLIDRFEVVQLPSASAMVWLDSMPESPGPTRATVFADPDFGSRRPPLPEGRREAEIIERLLGADRVTTFLGSSANRDAVLLSLAEPSSLVHFATHGILDTEHPEESGLALAGASPEDMGFLSLRDIYGLRLSSELVVLSGCRTALGKDIPGEGPISLSWGFLQSGARHVLASLWRIEDRAAAVLIEAFYRGLLEQRLTPAAALRAAQLQARRHPQFGSPYYWSAFVLQGPGG